MDVSIIIVNYNTKELTDQCLNSIHKYTVGCEYEVILVDNASDDGSFEYFSNRSDVKYVYLKENLGFGKANNEGLKHAEGEFIFFLNSDTYLCNDAIGIFLNFCNSYVGKLGAVGCKLQDVNGNYIHSFAQISNVSQILLSYFFSPISPFLTKRFRAKDDEELLKHDIFEVGYVTGADIFIKRAVLEQCGFFDPDFFMYYEEVEMQYRFKKNGYTNMIISKPEIVHLEGMSQIKSSDRVSMKKMLMAQKSQMIFVEKTNTLMCYLIYRVMLFVIRMPFVLFSKYNFMEKKEYISVLLKRK